MATTPDPAKLSSPRIFLVRMLVFLILCGLIGFVLQRQIINAFMANPWLNGLILGVLLDRHYPVVHARDPAVPGSLRGSTRFRRADPGLAVARAPTLLAPMAAILGGERVGRVAISAQTMRAFLNSLATRLDEARDISRYLTGLLVFLGLLGTFWGLIETVGSVGGIINNLNVGGDADTVFNALKEGPGGAARRHGHLVFFVAVRTGRLAHSRLSRPANEPGAEPLLHELRGLAGDDGRGPWRCRYASGGTVPAGVTEAIERLRLSVSEAGSGKATTAAMANLAEAIQGLVQHMRAEQQMIREWADAQAKLNSDIRRYMEILSREAVDR